MSFKYFRPTVRKVTTTPKAPAFKNTASAERFADLVDASDILTNNSVEKHLAEVNFDDHGHSILKESGLTRGHSILENSFSEKLSGRDSILGGAGKQNESQFGADGARAAGAFGKGMAGDDNESKAPANEDTSIIQEVVCEVAGEIGGKVPVPFAGTISNKLCHLFIGGLGADRTETHTQALVDVKMGGPGGRPAPDDNGGGEGGFMTWKLQDQLSNGFKNAKDPITNPYNENQGGGVLTATEADLRNAKDPATNWGDDTYNNFMGAIEMNVGEISLKAPSTNWGDNYTSTTANVVETVFATVQDF